MLMLFGICKCLFCPLNIFHSYLGSLRWNIGSRKNLDSLSFMVWAVRWNFNFCCFLLYILRCFPVTFFPWILCKSFHPFLHRSVCFHPKVSACFITFRTARSQINFSQKLLPCPFGFILSWVWVGVFYLLGSFFARLND